MQTPEQQPKKQRRTVTILVLATVAMFGFGYALVPLYSTFCKITGINGKTGGQVTKVDTVVDESRWVTVEFLATNNSQLPWEFHPKVNKIRVHPGEVATTSYYAHNNADKDMTVQAVPSVSPGLAAQHLQKLECFCFTKQTMAAHVGREMPLRFSVDRKLPKDISTLTLSYTLFDLTGKD